MMTNSEISALISLLDDEDLQVYNNVSERLMSYGSAVIPMLESAWEDSFNPLLHERIELIINKINYSQLFEDFSEWVNDEENDLLKGAILAAKFHFPDLDESEVYNQVDRIKQKIWLELGSHLTPLEKINVFNQIFYKILGFGGNYNAKPEAKDYCINAVLESKNGNTISLGIIYLIVAQQLSLPVYGVNLFRHFILSYQKDFIDDFTIDNSQDAIFYINSMNKGMIFQRKDIDEYLKNMHQEPKTEFFTPASNKQIIKELLSYMHFYYVERNEYEKVEQLEKLRELF